MTPTRAALARLVEERLGIKLGPSRVHDVIDRWVRERAAARGYKDQTEFVASLAREAPDGPEWKELVRRVTNGQTYFMRDSEQLEIVVSVLARMRTDGPAQVWAPASSTGEEAYSLAMLCLERGVAVEILATDVNDERLATARAAIYDERAIARLSPQQRARFIDASRGVNRVASSVRDRVRFEHHNLLDATRPLPKDREGWDLILCRNVFIYFGQNQIERIARSFAGMLAKHGELVIGPSETLRTLDVPLESHVVGTRTLYRRPRRRSERPSDRSPDSPPDASAIPMRQSSSTPPRNTPKPPLDWVAWLDRGHEKLRAHAFDQAATCYQAAVRASELAAEAHFFIGLLACKRTDTDAAIHSLRRALFLDPACWPARLLLVGAYERLPDARAAALELAALESALKKVDAPFAFESGCEGIAAADVSPDEARAVVARRRKLTTRSSA